MRKFLLLGTAAAIAAWNASADVLQPKQINDCIVMATSPDGYIGLSDDELGTVAIMNYKTNEIRFFDPKEETFPDGTIRYTEVYSRGMGNCVSNTGLALISTTDARSDGSYWENGEFKQVARPESKINLVMLNGVNADGTVICGVVGAGMEMTDNMSCMAYPIVWTRGEDGEFSRYTMLPVPERDFTGRMPQMITAVSISEDGKTIAGQVWDYFGFVAEPIVYTQNDNGEWSYRLIEPQFYNLQWPENPGEPPTQPEPTDFMSEAGIKAYNDAIDAYNSGSSVLPPPDPQQFMTPEEWQAYQDAYADWDPAESPFPPAATDFMTEEERAEFDKATEYYWEHYEDYPVAENYMTKEEYDKYAAAVSAYNEAFKVYYDKFEEFQIAYTKYLEEIPQFDKNNVFISGNGRYYATTAVVENQGTPYRYDLQKEGDPDIYTEDIYLKYVNSDGVLMGGAPLFTYSRTGMILDLESDDFIQISDYIKEKNPELYTWVEENAPEVGTPLGAQDLSIIWGWTHLDDYTTNILPVKAYTSGISDAVAAPAFDMTVGNDGTLNFTSNPSSVTICDINGAIVYSAENPGMSVSPALSDGIYIVKAANDSESLIRKIVL